MTTFSNEELQVIDVIKYHIITEAEKNGIVPEEEVTDKVALQYALGVTNLYIKGLYEQPKQKRRFFSKN